MKENKRYIATPITEELLKTLEDDKIYSVIKMGNPGTESGKVIKKHYTDLYITTVLLEQPLLSSVTAEEILDRKTHHHYEIEGIEHEVLLDGVDYDDAIDAMKEYAQLQTTAPSFPAGYVPTEDEKVLLNRILKRGEPSFPSDEERRLQAEKMFPYRKGIEGESFYHDGFEDACEWLLSYKEQSKNKGGKE